MQASRKVYRLLSAAASDNAAVAFNGPTLLNTILGQNVRASTVFLKLYQLGSNLALPLSTDTPFLTIALPAASAFAIDLGKGAAFPLGMGLRMVTGSPDNDANAVAAADVVGLNLLAS